MKRTSRPASRFIHRLAAGLLALAACGGAHAEVWGYVDARGVAHFATEKLDERYELFFRGGESFDTARGVGTPRAVAVPTAPRKLIAFFEVSPSFKQVKHHLREASRQHGVEYELLQALIATESGFDPDAVSPKGAIGLMQVLPATAERYGVTGDKTVPAARKLADPRTNIRAGTRYLRDLIAMFPGRLELALAAYNAGEGAVQRAGNRIPNYPETQKYVKTVLQLYNVLKPPSALGSGFISSAPGATVAMGAGRAPQRVRMQLPAPAGEAARAMPAGGAVGRGNLPPAGASFPLPDVKTERD